MATKNIIKRARGRLKMPRLGLLSLSALVMGSVIGSGIFNLMKEMAIDSSIMAVIIAWVIAGIGMGALAYSFYNLNKKRPELEAGVYSYAEAGFGKFMGFNSAWGYWISAWIGNVAYATMTFSALGYFFSIFGDGYNLAAVIGASVGLWLVAALIMSGIKNASFMNIIVTVAKFVPLVIFVIALIAAFKLNIFRGDLWGEAMKNGAVQWSELLNQVKGTMLATVFVFIGIEGAVVLSGRADQSKNVGKATALGFVTVLALYVLITVLSFGAMTSGDMVNLSEPAMGGLLESIVGKWGAVLINIGVIVSVVGAWLAWTLFALELPYRAAKRSVFPKVFAKESKKGVPWLSLLVTTIVTQVFVFSFLISDRPYNLMFSLCASMILLPYLFSALFQLKESWKEKRGTAGRGWNITVGLVAVIYAAWLLYAGGLEYLLTMVILYAVGLPIYIWARKDHGSKTIFKTWEGVIAVALIAIAIYGVYWMATGGYATLVG
ncbi:basic amino acid/polyamine antiporter [Candidatus Saccharibacteria bacterium]|nr:basic amino acid/polyamine antiporter [Candidatus Saccharibacteria bacterium]